jgi:hypothetical protein
MYFRNCPNCGREIEYKSQRGLSYAIKCDSTCKKCYQKLHVKQRKATLLKYNNKTKDYRSDFYKNRFDSSKKRRNMHLKSRYGLSIEEYDKLLEEQGRRCAICNIHQSEIKTTFHVDHDHSTGKRRKILCNTCNSLLGFAKDNIQTLLSAAEYLQKNNPAETGLIDFDI